MEKGSTSTLLTLSISVGVAMIGLGIIWPLIPVYAVQMGAGGLMVGLIIASFNLARSIFSPVAGRFSDKLGRKNFIVTGLFAYAFVSILYVLPSHAAPLIAVRFLHGMASLLVVPISMALAADIAPHQEMGKYMGTLNMSIMAGLGIGPILGGGIRDLLGINAAFYAMGLIAFITAFMVIFLVPSDRSRRTGKETAPAKSFLEILKNRTVIGIFMMRFFSASGQGAVYTFLPILAIDLGLTGSQVGIVLGANIFLIAFLQRYCGIIADRINPKYLVITGTCATGFAVMGMPFVHGFALILCLNIFMGFSNGIAHPGGLVIMGRLGRTMGMGTLMSVTDAAWSLGMIVSPILSGIILDLFGVSYIFILGSLLILFGSAVLTVFLWDYQTEPVV